MARASKPKESVKNEEPDKEPRADVTVAAFFSGPPPTYPLSPTEIEMILHIRWNGKTFERSERAGKEAIVLEGAALQDHARRLPFDPERRKIENRSVEYDILNEDDFSAMLHRAHRVQLVTADGNVPEALMGENWISGRKGVSKPDGIGILLSRPMK